MALAVLALCVTSLAAPAPPPPRLAGLVGEYGPDEATLYVREDAGRLEALVKGGRPEVLEEVAPDVFRRPSGEGLAFRRDGEGRAREVRVGTEVLPRRAWGVEGRGVFRVSPVRPVETLVREARAAQPPAEAGPFRDPDLVELSRLDPTIRLDIRYATTDNFLGTRVYGEARAFLQRPAAAALERVNRKLKDQGYGLLLHDAYRPWWVTRVFWEATPKDKRAFVADPAQGSRHNRGCAVDLTLYRREDGRAVEMPGVYDEMSERSYPDFPGGSARQRWHRDLLRAAMEAEGFTVFDSEWWHFDFREWKRYAILNLGFESLR